MIHYIVTTLFTPRSEGRSLNASAQNQMFVSRSCGPIVKSRSEEFPIHLPERKFPLPELTCKTPGLGRRDLEPFH